MLELAVDSMLQQPGIVLIQSVGNYADAAMHTHARIGPDQRRVLEMAGHASTAEQARPEVLVGAIDPAQVLFVPAQLPIAFARHDERIHMRLQ